MPTTHSFDFDPAYGLSVEELLAIEPPAEPEGFDAFWRARYHRARAVDPQPVLSSSQSRHPDWQVFDITFLSTGGFAIGGWLLLPPDGIVTRGLVVGHGYGGREQPDFDMPVQQTAMLFPCFRGLSRSTRAPIPADPAGHVLQGIDDPEHYIIGGCVEDLWLAVSTLAALYPHLVGRIGYSGISFGGGIGALAMPFDARIDRGYLEVPTFGHRPLWLDLPTTGSASAVQVYRQDHPDVLKNLALFDAATAASRIGVPMLVAAALFDPAVAPPCQFAVANALPKFNEIFILAAGHFDYDDGAAQQTQLREKIGQHFRVP